MIQEIRIIYNYFTGKLREFYFNKGSQNNLFGRGQVKCLISRKNVFEIKMRDFYHLWKLCGASHYFT